MRYDWTVWGGGYYENFRYVLIDQNVSITVKRD
jgi:hypothetical protein